MRYVVNLKASQEACQLTTAEERYAIATEAMKEAEKRELNDNDEAVFDGPNGLKIAVLWATKTVHIITKDEADRAYVPKKTDLN